MVTFQNDDRNRDRFCANPLRHDVYIALRIGVDVDWVLRLFNDVVAGVSLPEHEALVLRNPSEGFADVCDDELDRPALKERPHVVATKMALAHGREWPTLSPELG